MLLRLFVLSCVIVHAATGFSCCGSDYEDFVDDKCVGSDNRTFAPALKCDKYVVLAESWDDFKDEDEGSCCFVDVPGEDGLKERLVVICDESQVPFHVKYLFPVSVAFAFLTVLVYCLRGNPRASLQDAATTIIAACLGTVMLVRIIYYFNLDSDTWFAMDEYLGKFALIAYFSWLNCLLLANVLIKLMNDGAQDKDGWEVGSKTSWLIAAHCYGWSIPSLVIYSNAVQLFGDYSSDYVSREWYYKYLPISILWAINLLLCLVLAHHFCGKAAWSCSHLTRALLFNVIWFPWIFEVLSTDSNDLEFSVWSVMDIVNSLQGVLIFFTTVACQRSRVRIARIPMWSRLDNDTDTDADSVKEFYVKNLSAPFPGPGPLKEGFCGK